MSLWGHLERQMKDEACPFLVQLIDSFEKFIIICTRQYICKRPFKKLEHAREWSLLYFDPRGKVGQGQLHGQLPKTQQGKGRAQA